MLIKYFAIFTAKAAKNAMHERFFVQIFAPELQFKSAFICVYPRFRFALTPFIAVASARIELLDFRRASPHWIPGAT